MEYNENDEKTVTGENKMVWNIKLRIFSSEFTYGHFSNPPSSGVWTLKVILN